MIHARALRILFLAPAVLAGALLSAEASQAACPEGAGVRVALCGGAGRAEVLLLPEDAWKLHEAAPGALTVTGAYTGGEREPGKPKPVGVFLARGERISLELARMDGLLVVEQDGRARISTYADAELSGARFDLSDLEGRVAFARAAEQAGASALQSHLLIRDGALDLREVEDAPLARRRILFQTEAGDLAVWESAGALTLYDAAQMLMEAHAPRMALNLDMGGHDYCEQRLADGTPAPCGIVSAQEEGKLSNVIRLSPAGG